MRGENLIRGHLGKRAPVFQSHAHARPFSDDVVRAEDGIQPFVYESERVRLFFMLADIVRAVRLDIVSDKAPESAVRIDSRRALPFPVPPIDRVQEGILNGNTVGIIVIKTVHAALRREMFREAGGAYGAVIDDEIVCPRFHMRVEVSVIIDAYDIQLLVRADLYPAIFEAQAESGVVYGGKGAGTFLRAVDMYFEIHIPKTNVRRRASDKKHTPIPIRTVFHIHDYFCVRSVYRDARTGDFDQAFHVRFADDKAIVPLRRQPDFPVQLDFQGGSRIVDPIFQFFIHFSFSPLFRVFLLPTPPQ